MAKKTDEAEVVIANILDLIEADPIDTPREWTWAEQARLQLTGEYPEWYIPPKE